MGRKKTRRGRLHRIAAGLAATAAAFIPGVAAASALPAAEAIEAATRTTTPERLLELANTYPDQVLGNRALRRLRAEDPDAHREILLAARFARAEIPLARTVARTDRPTLRLFACDCATRVATLYERLGCDTALLQRAREEAAAAVKAPPEPAPLPAAAPSGMTALGMALARVEHDVSAFEREVQREATIAGGAMSALGQVAVAAREGLTRRAEGAGPDTPRTEPPRRMLAVAMAAARAIDDALLVAAGGSVDRIDTMREAIAEAIYLDHIFRTGEAAGAVDAVFRELAWQRAHLHALRAGATAPVEPAPARAG
jgi:hypothetical protein